MSYERGMQAIRLEMPDTIPHTEYISNPDLLAAVTGLKKGTPEFDENAYAEFVRITDFDFIWTTDAPPFERFKPAWMGSARYSEEQELRPAEYPFKTEEEVLSFDPVEEIGIPDKDEIRVLFEKNWRERSAWHDVVMPTGYYNTIFTWNILTFGWELFMAAAVADPVRFDRVLDGFFQITMPIFEAVAESEIPIFLCHDDIVWASGPVFNPAWYRKYIFPRIKKYWEPLRDANKTILFCSDGNFDEFVDDIADCGANGFIFEPLTDLAMVAEKYGQTHVIMGNADCRILMYGSKDDIEMEVKRMTDIGRDLPGYFYAMGNHIPYNVPVDNALYYFDMKEKYGKR
jgi:hypothetical protein